MDIFVLIYIFILFSLSYFTFFHLILWYESRQKSLPRNLKDSELPYVSILIPSYNEDKVIGKTLKKLLLLNYPKNKLEIIVVDDGSTDKTYKIARKYESDIVKVLTKPNTGKASSLNFGISHARHPFIAVIDADSFLDKNALRNCMKYFDRDVASVTSHILVKQRKTLWEKLQHIEFMVVALMRKAQERLNIIGVTPGPLSIYRKNVLTKLGGFDEKNLVEDIEIAWRILKRGYKVRMAFDAMVYSLYPDTLKMWWKQRIRWGIGGLQTFIKYFSSMFSRKAYTVGDFLVPVSFFSYILAFIGIGIFLYLFAMKTFDYLTFIITAYYAGVNPFKRFDFVYNVDLLIIYGVLLFVLSLFVIRLALTVHNERPKFTTLILFITLYPMLLTSILLYSTYKFIKKERGWLTK